MIHKTKTENIQIKPTTRIDYPARGAAGEVQRGQPRRRGVARRAIIIIIVICIIIIIIIIMLIIV